MGRPTLITLNGTASAVWTPDWMENPFVVGITLNTGTTGVNGTAIIEYTLADPNTVDAVSTTAPNYFTIVALTGANATANWTTPCQAIRVSVVTATATSVWQAAFVQATTPP